MSHDVVTKEPRHDTFAPCIFNQSVTGTPRNKGGEGCCKGKGVKRGVEAGCREGEKEVEQ